MRPSSVTSRSGVRVGIRYHPELLDEHFEPARVNLQQILQRLRLDVADLLRRGA